jgi:hypothetical protein
MWEQLQVIASTAASTERWEIAKNLSAGCAAMVMLKAACRGFMHLVQRIQP